MESKKWIEGEIKNFEKKGRFTVDDLIKFLQAYYTSVKNILYRVCCYH